MIDLPPASRRTAELMANIGHDQLASRTPCPDYTPPPGKARPVGDAVPFVHR